MYMVFMLNKREFLLKMGVAAILGFLFRHGYSEMTIVMVTLIFTVNNIDSYVRFLKDNNSALSFHSMPIGRRDIVKGTFLISLILLVIFFVIITPFQLHAGIHHDKFVTYSSLLTGALAFGIAAIANQLYFYFANPHESDLIESYIAVFGMAALFITPHAIIIISTDFAVWKLFIMPVISVFVFIYFMKRAIMKYEEVEVAGA